MNYYNERYESNIKKLDKFMTSNYVKELKKKYDPILIELGLSGLSEDEFDMAKFNGINIPKLSKVEQLEILNKYYKQLLEK